MLERNLRTYGLYAPLANALFWAPVFFLFLSQRFALETILGLHAFYYAVILGAEVPSGYLSDRVGRVLTLRLAAGAAIVSYALFVLGAEDLFPYVLAQVALALHFSFRSGTEASFLYDTLAALGRAGEYAAVESQIQRNRYLAGAVGALAGGAVAFLDLRAAYGLSLVGAFGMLALTLRMTEPPHLDDRRATDFVHQLRDCFGSLRQPFLAWIFGYVVLQTTLDHLPYEFYQPYIAAVLGESARDVARTPLVTGAVSACISLVGAYAATHTLRVRDRLGTSGTLLALTGVQTLLIGLMAAWIHPIVVPLIALRSVAPSIGQVVISAAVAPRVHQSLRATYLSLQNLAGTLAYSAVLAALARVAGPGAEATAEGLSALLRAGTLLALVGLVVLALTAKREPSLRS